MNNFYTGLDSEQLSTIIKYYRTPDRSSGRAKTVKWSSRRWQVARFKIFENIGNLYGKSILDVGCGLGDLLGYLQRTAGKTDYTGIDLMPEFIDRARRDFPEGKFFNQELGEVRGQFDYVLSSGALNTKIPDHLAVHKSMIKHMYKLSNLAVGFNMLNIAEHQDDDIYCSYNPQEILTFCRSFAGEAKLVTGYLSHDFTIFLYH